MGPDDVIAALALAVLLAALVVDQVEWRATARHATSSRSGNGARSGAHNVYGAPAAVSHALRRVVRPERQSANVLSRPHKMI